MESLDLRQIEVFRRMTPAQKLDAAAQLYFSARALKESSIRQLNPNLSEKEVAQRVKESFMYARS